MEKITILGDDGVEADMEVQFLDASELLSSASPELLSATSPESVCLSMPGPSGLSASSPAHPAPFPEHSPSLPGPSGLSSSSPGHPNPFPEHSPSPGPSGLSCSSLTSPGGIAVAQKMRGKAKGSHKRVYISNQSHRRTKYNKTAAVLLSKVLRPPHCCRIY